MSLVSSGLKKPIAVVVITLGVLLFSVLAIFTIPIDIFPKLNLPTIYVIEPYGGMSAQQMEGFFATRMQDQFLYVNGIKNIESKNIQGISIIKLTFYETTDMAEASAQVALQVNRASAFFPPGALPPQVVRFDASSLPVGELVFSSPTRPLKDIYDLALTRVRPMFATVPGLSAPPPFGSNARSVIINIDPERIRGFNLSPDQVVAAIAKNNSISPSGNIRINNTMYVTTLNSLEQKVEAFDNIPVVNNGNSTVFVRDIGRVSDAADITIDYALVNGRRSVYIPVVKTSDASTWDVVKGLKAKLPEIQTLLPEDVHVSYEFDQSVFVINAVKSLMTEGVLGAILTGLMVLLFLQDWRSSLVVIITIPVSVLSAVLLLKLAGQTINIMTLSGLALAIGVLVDQATVTIENIHQHLEMGKPKRQAIYEACEEISFPLLLILLCILAVFAPALIMTGVPKAMFLPLSLAIGFAMIASYFLAQTLVPILSNWILKAEKFMYRHGHQHAHAGLALNTAEVDEVRLHGNNERTVPEKNDRFQRFKMAYTRRIEALMRYKGATVSLYFLVVFGCAGLAFVMIGKDLMPKVNTGQFQLRIKEPDGTRLEVTEHKLHDVLDIVNKMVDGHVAISSAFVGPVPTNFGSSNLYVFNSGTHEGILQVNLDEKYKVNMDELKDEIRKKIAAQLPEMKVSFEPIDLTEKIMSQGASTPIEVRVAGRDMQQIGHFAGKLVDRLEKVSFLRDVQIAQPLKFPVININVDRFKAAQMGINLSDVARSVTAATSSSRYTQKNLWLDDRTSYTYQVQVQVPEYIMHEVGDLKEIPLVEGQPRPVLEDIANFSIDSLPGEYDRAGPRRYVTVSANIYKKDLGAATAAVQMAIKELGAPPRGLVTEIKGTSSLLVETLSGLQNGLAIAIVVIFLLLAANYQSFKVSLAVLTTVPAVILGSLIALLLTGSTLNLQSYMGMIMSTGVSVANAILIVTNAEKLRMEYKDASRAAVTSASIRLRPILMTSLAMIAGMIPMASGMGEAGDQTAPLGRAVIGGLVFSTLAALLILPQVYALVQKRTNFSTPSLMPEANQNIN
ncbi:efflux RND transporter permease subunit [Flavitalea sp. BT771]|uniref:efflux RND transporter permease subunit n=1 Tax=Flavitalea sp. BT771 TaxID=3063329 RepID=UPI0026E29E93|nr:efflux RND transporter permease subunit [Flavitalea sp. BT771]MDO6434032.1 efflux RND transporter permease subunit [Flavitalea sp. BT771]MDV6222932.1 efflux RND transporter permease subunit [Flavitalea sp. BT771]